MIETFTVKGFKSLVEVSVDLGAINVFIGANGSGKSNLLEALGVLGASASGRVNDESLKYRGVRPGLPRLYKSSFKNRKTEREIGFMASADTCSYGVTLWNPLEKPSADWKYKTERLTRDGKQIIGRSPATKTQLNDNAGLAALKVVEMLQDDPAGELLDLLRNYAIYSPNTPTLRGLEPDPQAREPLGLAGGRLAEALKEMFVAKKENKFRELLGLVGWTDSIGVRWTSEIPISGSVPQPKFGLLFADKFMREERGTLSAYDASEGVLYLLFCAALALHPKAPKLFAIDNFDQALNPRTARDFTRLFCEWILEKQDRQVLLTTHNPLVLDGLPLQNDSVRLFAVDRSKHGQTVVQRVSITPNLLEEAEKGIPLSQQWVMGNFGGVPDSV